AEELLAALQRLALAGLGALGAGDEEEGAENQQRYTEDGSRKSHESNDPLRKDRGLVRGWQLTVNLSGRPTEARFRQEANGQHFQAFVVRVSDELTVGIGDKLSVPIRYGMFSVYSNGAQFAL